MEVDCDEHGMTSSGQEAWLLAFPASLALSIMVHVVWLEIPLTLTPGVGPNSPKLADDSNPTYLPTVFNSAMALNLT